MRLLLHDNYWFLFQSRLFLNTNFCSSLVTLTSHLARCYSTYYNRDRDIVFFAMVDMRNDGGQANPLPTDDNDDSRSQRFTAVNNGGGNGNGSLTVVSHRPQLPPIVPQPQPVRDGVSNGSASTVNSAEEQWRQGVRSGSVEMSGTSQKRKRSPEISSQQKRAITPTTQVTHHHLAAHEAAMAEENSGNAHHTNHHRNQSSLGPDDHTGNYSVDEEMKGNDDGRTRAGTQDGSPPPGTAHGDPKKRKRVFSNRTKTGCITCRRRKKKCDEGKPECSFRILLLVFPGRATS